MRDNLLDWEDPLDDHELNIAEDNARRSDLVLALGTSLRIEPAGSIPLLCKEARPREANHDEPILPRHFVIINLQEGAKDAAADLIIRAKVDEVFYSLMKSAHELSRKRNSKND